MNDRGSFIITNSFVIPYVIVKLTIWY